MKFEVSIIVVNYNTPNLLVDCVKSVEKSGLKSSYEVVVVDNGSEKVSVKKIKELQKNGLINKIVLNEENLGFSKANNLGLKKSEGKYKLLLNSDTVVKEGAIDSLIEFARKTKDAGVIGSRLLNEDGSIQPSCYNFPTIKTAIQQYWLKNGSPMDKFAPKSDEPTAIDALVGAAFLITPKALKKVGPLEEKYFMFYEDLDYCRRVWQKGLKVYYLPSSEIIHLHGRSGKQVKENKDQWRRLIPSSKIYHGILKHYIINFILWSGQKLRK